MSFKMSVATTVAHTALVIRQTKRQLAITVAGRVFKERSTPDTYTKGANLTRCLEACRPVRIFDGLYAKDTYIQTVKQEKLYVVNTDPSWAPGKKWFVVDHTQDPCVIFDSYGAQSLPRFVR